MKDDTIEELVEALRELWEALRTITALIGNVDHSIGHGERSAKMRGDLLNDIRSIARNALRKEQS